MKSCSEKEAEQLQSWQEYVEKNELPPADKLKKLCRKGVPPELRPFVWMRVSGASRRQQQQHSSYFAAMHRVARHESPFAHQIELDLPRTYPSNAWVQGEEGQAALRRVLCAFAQHKQDVGYCQGLNYIAAMLLLVMERDEEKAFWLLASLIDDASEGILYQDMFSNNLSGTHVEMRSLWELVSSKLPRLAQHLQALKCDISILATDWFMCLFATTLPAETVARVWDTLFSEGPKVLFRVALAVLKLLEPALLAQEDTGELLGVLRASTHGMVNRDQLLKVAFDGIGSMPMLAIKRYRQVSQAQVDHELALRETNKNLQRALREGFVIPEEEVHVLREAESHPEAGQLQDEGEGGSSAGRGVWRVQLQTIGEKYRERMGRGKERWLGHRQQDATDQPEVAG